MSFKSSKSVMINTVYDRISKKKVDRIINILNSLINTLTSVTSPRSPFTLAGTIVTGVILIPICSTTVAKLQLDN